MAFMNLFRGPWFSDRVLRIILEAGGRIDTGNLHDRLCETERRRINYFKMYNALDRLVARGLIKQEKGKVPYPERGGRIRYYYEVIKGDDEPGVRGSEAERS